ncbi:hypothetical protein NQ318_006108 [Aromia moschata]|uniref:Uncharacterized protein n=1 Tax=Aromia moschata TaxID=1265417 RepID=A0AAV8Z4U8_9CUCU|nr:hypothetical protein NQ318_006108 [Aromia moschata]
MDILSEMEETVKKNSEVSLEASISEKTPKKNLWDEIVEQSEKDKREVEAYIKSKNADSDVFPEPLATMNKVLFPLILEGLVEMLHKIKDDDSFYVSKGIDKKSTLDGLDYLSEYIYNMNPKYPDRKSNWTYIFDMEWVVYYLDQIPRPYYPFHLVWSREFAALKIQSYMRGYWARIRPDVLEVRDFWKALKADKEEKERAELETNVDSKELVLPPLNIK